MPSPQAYRPALEALEARELLSIEPARINLHPNGTLTISPAYDSRSHAVVSLYNAETIRVSGVIGNAFDEKDFAIKKVKLIDFRGGKDDDYFKCDPKLTIPVRAYGGAGDDTLIGGKGDDILDGGTHAKGGTNHYEDV